MVGPISPSLASDGPRQPHGIAMTTIDNASLETLHRMDLPVRGQALHPLLVSFPIAYFTAAFVSDLAYWRTAAVLWRRSPTG